MRLAPCQLGSSFLRFLGTLASFKSFNVGLSSSVSMHLVQKFTLPLCIVRLFCSQARDRIASASLSSIYWYVCSSVMLNLCCTGCSSGTPGVLMVLLRHGPPTYVPSQTPYPPPPRTVHKLPLSH